MVVAVIFFSVRLNTSLLADSAVLRGRTRFDIALPGNVFFL